MLAALLAGALLAAPVLMPAGHRLPTALRLAGAALCALFSQATPPTDDEIRSFLEGRQ